MINLTSNIDIVNDIPRITKWQVVDVHDYADQLPPYLMVVVTLFGPNSVAFNSYTLCVRNDIASTILQVNSTPQQVSDQFVYAESILAATPYTTLAALWNGSTTPSTRPGRLKAVEAALVAAGALAPEFAGT
jgi:hypothetical protein